MREQIKAWIKGKEDLDQHMEDYFAAHFARTVHEWMKSYKIEDGRVHVNWIDSNDTDCWHDFPVKNLWEKM
jgi:hypothetical protein